MIKCHRLSTNWCIICLGEGLIGMINDALWLCVNYPKWWLMPTTLMPKRLDKLSSFKYFILRYVQMFYIHERADCRADAPCEHTDNHQYLPGIAIPEKPKNWSWCKVANDEGSLKEASLLIVDVKLFFDATQYTFNKQ